MRSYNYFLKPDKEPITLSEALNDPVVIEEIIELLNPFDIPDFGLVDYFGTIDINILYIIYDFEWLPTVEKLSLEEDIANLQSTYPTPYFSSTTNKLISKILNIVQDNS